MFVVRINWRCNFKLAKSPSFNKHLLILKNKIIFIIIELIIGDLFMKIEKDAENILNKFSKTLENIPDLEETWYITDNLNLTREDKSHEKHPEKILRNAHIDKEGKLVVKRADWVYGGQPIGRQIRVLNKGVHVVIGTPGRVLDHIERKTLDLKGISTVVLDEADEMLDMGFREDIEKILRHTPKQRQTLLFSATMPKEIKRITKFYQKKPKHLKVAQSQMTVPEITQYYFETKEKDKLENLTRLIDVYDVNLGLVFCNTKKRVDWVAKNLRNRGYAAEGIHGDMNQKSRDKVMNKFRNGNIEILIATDVAARGIDVPNVEVVVNYDVPQNPEYYVHRIGRTGRAGNMGYAFTFVAGKEIYSLRTIKKVTKSKIKQRKIPSYKEMESIKNTQLMNSVKNSIEKDNLEKYVKLVEGAMEEDFDSVDIAAALLKMVKEN